ncbi:MAG TPA: MaoC family dehydratase [Candidatus Aquilonibacter sp.]|nr:MaoC family dehydratase [Candidatus Aquilonibacter sp.]
MTYPERFFDEFVVGDTFETQAFTLSEKESTAFAHLYDPQPFHLDAQAAAESPFHELVASGWQTAAITMRLVVECGVLRATGVIGTGIDDLRWLAPVHPGDTLRVRGEIVDKLPWPGKPGRGTMRVRLHTVNQHGVVVMSQIANCMAKTRST